MKHVENPGDIHLPTTSAEGLDGMLQLADLFGEVEAFKFLGLCHGNNSPIGEVRAILAARSVSDQMRRTPEAGYRGSRITVAKSFGYAGTGLSNFNKLANRGRELLRERGEWKHFDTAGDE